MSKKTEKIFVRSILDLGDYCDDEVKPSQEKSLTDPSQDEPIERLVLRLLRGEAIASIIPTYDSEKGEAPADLIAQQSVAEREGFDLSDVPRVMEAGKRAEKALKKVKKLEATPPASVKENPKEKAPEPSPEAPK